MKLKYICKKVDDYNQTIKDLDLRDNQKVVVFVRSYDSYKGNYKELSKIIKKEFVKDYADEILNTEFDSALTTVASDGYIISIDIENIY